MYHNPNPAIYLWRNIEMNAIQEVIKNIDLPKYVCDLGCGDKSISKYLFPDKKIIGIDIKGNPDITADIYLLPFEKESVNFIFCNSVLEHLTKIDLALYNISRVLKKGGIFIFTVPIDNLNDNIKDNFPFSFHRIINKSIGHKNLFTYSVWKYHLLAYDIKIIKSGYYLNEQSTHHWAKMLLLQKLFGTLFFNKKKLDRIIREDDNGCFGSCIAFLTTKI